MDLTDAFVAQSREYLTRHYLPKIRLAVEPLGDDDLWWRPNEASNSIGNLLLHLEGNLRQWILSGLGGSPDRRDRAAEFARREPLPRARLLGLFATVVGEVDAVLARADGALLARRFAIQGRQVTGLQAIYHVVEHVSYHAAQIIYIAKLRTGSDLGFYTVEAGVARAAWPGRPESGSA